MKTVGWTLLACALTAALVYAVISLLAVVAVSLGRYAR